MQLYKIFSKQKRILTEVEEGRFSQKKEKVGFSEQQRPGEPSEEHFKFLYKSLEKAPLNQTTTQFQKSKSQKVRQEQNTSGMYVLENRPEDVSIYSIKKEEEKAVDLKVDVEQLGEEDLKEYVLALMTQQERTQATHPSALKGESLQEVKQDLELFKRKFEQTKRETNNIRVQIEAQKRIIERNQLEKSQLNNSRPVSGKVRPATAKSRK